jgi:hypothetical protein
MRIRLWSAFAFALAALVVSGGGVFAQERAGAATLQVTVLDETAAVLPGAAVVLVGPDGVEQTLTADQRGVVAASELAPGLYEVRASMEAFRPTTQGVTLRRGANRVTITLPLAIREEVTVTDVDAAERRDNGFTQTLTQEEIDALSDDPDEMADQLAQMAGPGAQIFVDGFRGGRLPPKDQIQQIRFRSNSYAAEYHDAGMVRVEVITKPGLGNWRSRANFGFRDEAMNAPNAVTGTRPPEQVRRLQVNSQGPIVKGKTSVSFSAEGNSSYDSQTIVATTPVGEVRNQVRRPNDVLNATVRVEQALSAGSALRAEYQRRSQDRDNLGVGDFDLPERAYGNTVVTDTIRLRNTRVINKNTFTEIKVEFVQSTSDFTSFSTDPTLKVLESFTRGGAGQSGERKGQQFIADSSLDFTVRKHALRAGLLFEAGQWDSTQQTNANGTYTFSNLDAFDAGLARNFVIRVGDPLVSYSQYQAGWYLQDDFRLNKNFQVSLGLRQELQTHVDDKWNLAPRAAFTWTVAKTNVRGGYGIFYDWFDSGTYEQTVRVDGTHQIDQVIENVVYPLLDSRTGTVLPPSVIVVADHLDQPIVQQASIGLDKNLTQTIGLRADYMWTRGTGMLRAFNVNAPVDGIRPDLTRGNVTQISSTGERAQDRLTVGLNWRVPSRRIFTNLMYQYANTRNHADSALSLPADSLNPDADWGPSAQDVRHRLFAMVNLPLPFNMRAGVNMQLASARPYNVTTGFDDNGDTVFNDRPAGVSRNSARGAATATVDLRLTKSFNLGGLLSGGPEGVPMGGPPGPPPGGAALQRGPGGGPGGGGGEGGPQMVVMEGSNSRYRLDLYVSAQNLFNRANYNAFVGNLQSVYFGTATSAAPPRRLEVGATISF